MFVLFCKLIGVLLSVLLVVLSAIFGMGLLRLNGVETMYRAQAKMQQGQSPDSELLKGFAISFGAILLIIPGLLTSFLGLLLIIPGCRRFLGGLFIKKNWFKSRQQQWQQQSANDQTNPESSEKKGGRTIEGDFKEE